MTYLLFDLVAVALPAALLLYGAQQRKILVKPVGALALVALLWTAPWDEYLSRTSVWTYDPAGVVLTVLRGDAAPQPLDDLPADGQPQP